MPIDSLIGLRFSTRIEAKSANVQTVQLSGPDGNLVTAAVVPAEDGMLVFVSPASALSLDSSYTVSIRGVTDTAGTALPDTYIRFTTAGKKDSLKDDQTFKASTNKLPDPVIDELPPLKAAQGVTALAGRALMLDGKPLVGVTLRIDQATATTDGTGRFLLTNVTAGHHEMVIDGRTAHRPNETCVRSGCESRRRPDDCFGSAAFRYSAIPARRAFFPRQSHYPTVDAALQRADLIVISPPCSAGSRYLQSLTPYW